MKLTKKDIQGIIQTSIESRDKSRIESERQQGVILLCEWLLQKYEFDEASITENKE